MADVHHGHSAAGPIDCVDDPIDMRLVSEEKLAQFAIFFCPSPTPRHPVETEDCGFEPVDPRSAA
jgi:hypothetical protein